MHKKCKLSISGNWLPYIQNLPTDTHPSVALSFDDGPHPATTPQLLLLLKKHNAQATFFVTGERAEQYPDLIRLILSAGHALYGHSYNHIALRHAKKSEVIDQLIKAEAVLAAFRPTQDKYLVRLPYGSGHRDPRMHRIIRKWRTSAQICQWGIAPKDFAIAEGVNDILALENKCQILVDKFVRETNFINQIILLHDHPYDQTHPLTNRGTLCFLEKLLIALDKQQLKSVAIQPHIQQKFAQKFIIRY